MNETIYIGLAVTSHNYSCTAEARLSNVDIIGSVTPDGPFAMSDDISPLILSDLKN